MDDETREGFSRLPVQRIAERMLQAATADPLLLSRGRALATTAETSPAEPAEIAFTQFPPMSLLSDPTFDVRQYLEDLVSITVTSSREAEYIARQAREASRKARRAMVVVGALGALGVLTGIAGFAAQQLALERLTQVTAEVHRLQDTRRSAGAELAAMTTMGAGRQEPSASAEPPAQAAPEVPKSAPTVWRTPIPHSDPWPTPRPPTHRVYATRSQVVFPGFLRALFR